MKATEKVLILVLLFTSLTIIQLLDSNAQMKQGSNCKRVNKVIVVANSSFKCTKAGKKLVWRKIPNIAIVTPPVEVTPVPATEPITSPSPTPETSTSTIVVPQIPTVPRGFDDLFENRKGVSYAAWKSVAETIQATPGRSVKLNLQIGPNTKPHFNDYDGAINLLARAFPNRSLPSQTLIIQFNSKDVDWADAKFRGQLTPSELSFIDSNEKDGFIRGNCPTESNCNGARQQTVPSGLSIIAHGVVTLNSGVYLDPRFTTGMLEVHEYFHSIQRIPLLNKDLGGIGWPHAWFSEGSAEFIQNAVVNHSNFDSYRTFARDNCDTSCRSLSEEQLVQFLSQAKGWSLPIGFNRWSNYSIGSVVVEILVALRGPDSILALYEAVGTRMEFAQAFEKVYGYPWNDAIPIIAKTLYANLNDK